MCGIVGVYGTDAAAEHCRFALKALQHRGQESAGIAASNGSVISRVIGKGYVTDVFRGNSFIDLLGNSAIGQVRYATSGGPSPVNQQPLLEDIRYGQVALAHNGNLTNQGQWRHDLTQRGSILKSKSDSEILIHLMTLSGKETFEEALIHGLTQIDGAFNFVLLTPTRMYAVMDRYNFRPLVYGKVGNAHVVASETVALDILRGSKFIREVRPGEVMMFDEMGAHTIHTLPHAEQQQRCAFEKIYFARPDSDVFGGSVMLARNEMGRILARESPVEADIVVPVPDSGIDAAMGFAEESGIPYRRGLIRNQYAGRSFIEGEQKVREKTVRIKLNPVRRVIKGKRVIVIDDSVVRGTTCRKIVKMMKVFGAKEVHLRISSPPTTGPCFYGIDTPERRDLIAHDHSIEEIRRFVGADSLAYLSEPGLKRALGDEGRGYCLACINGNYPLGLDVEVVPAYDRRGSRRT